MNNAQLNAQLKDLTSKCEDVKHEKKLLTNDFESLKDIVKKSGIVSLILLIFRITVLEIFLGSKSASLKALGRFLNPFVIIVFLAAFLFFLVRGFDWFVNADTKYSKMVAKKLDKPTVSDMLDELNSKIARLELEIGQAENTLYEQGGSIEFHTAGSSDNDIVNTNNTAVLNEAILSEENIISEPVLLNEDNASEIYNEDNASEIDTENENDINDDSMVVVKRAKMEKRVIVDNIKLDDTASHRDEEANIFESDISNNNKKDVNNGNVNNGNINHLNLNSSNLTDKTEIDFEMYDKNSMKSNSIDDILNGLDDFSMDDDDEFENSSELWEKEAMKRYK